MPASPIEIVATALFVVAVLHTFFTARFERLAQRHPRHAGLFHLLGEVEVVFGFWAIVLCAAMALMSGGAEALRYVSSRNYTEPLFVFVIMVIAGSRPVLRCVDGAVRWLAARLPVAEAAATVWLGLAVVPLAGSLITEPAAMTLSALMLAPTLFRTEVPQRWRYLALGALLVNISIGGTLTSYAAPPVLMVATAWQWDSAYMLSHFGWKALLAVAINASLATALVRRHLKPAPPSSQPDRPVPAWITAVHLALLGAVVALSHYPVAFLGLFMLFLGFARAYDRHQDPLLIREALLVAFFLAGLVVLGGLQAWWLGPIVSSLSPLALFFGALGLTAVTDNAALTYLGSLIPMLSEEARYALVAGAVAGGGLTVIANAPNPAGIALLRGCFPDGAVDPGRLLAAALAPTMVAAFAFLGL